MGAKKEPELNDWTKPSTEPKFSNDRSWLMLFTIQILIQGWVYDCSDYLILHQGYELDN